MYRSKMYRSQSVTDIQEFPSYLGKSLAVILDIDNTVVPYQASSNTVPLDLDDARRRLERIERVERVIIATNGGNRGVSGVVDHAWKPFTSRKKLGLGPSEACIVVGDQILTDGLLAWRLRAPFVLCPIQTTGEPWWPALQRRAAGVFRRRLFVEEPV